MILYTLNVSVALIIQDPKRMRHTILTSVDCLTLPNLTSLSHKWHDFQKKLLNIKRVF
jgi:hypothetical protein